MQRYLTPADIANTVRLSRTLHSGAIVITEGDTDVRFYEHFFSNSGCLLIPSNGKQNAIQAALILEGNLPGVLTIVDADFNRLDAVPPPSPNILYTDSHDLETMILSSSSLSKVLSELVSPPKIKRLSKPVIDLAIQACLPLGYLRWLSSPTKNNLNLKFDGILLSRFIHLPSFTANIDKMINEVINNTRGSTTDPNHIKSDLATLMMSPRDVWQVCSGHDLVEAIFVGLKITFGNSKAKSLTPALLDAMLRMAFNKSDFESFGLFRAIGSWQENNAGFQVLQ